MKKSKYDISDADIILEAYESDNNISENKEYKTIRLMNWDLPYADMKVPVDFENWDYDQQAEYIKDNMFNKDKTEVFDEKEAQMIMVASKFKQFDGFHWDSTEYDDEDDEDEYDDEDDDDESMNTNLTADSDLETTSEAEL